VVTPSQTGVLGLMSQVGLAFTGIVTVHEPGQPSLLMVSVKVYEQSTSVGPANTWTVGPVLPPTIEPQPVMAQLWVTVPPPGETVEV
jgi:hypothetical protein